MTEVKLIRYYLKLTPLGVQQNSLITLDEVAEKFSSSKRHARTLVQQMQSLQWLTWVPAVGRHQRSRLYLHFSPDGIRHQVAGQLVRQGIYEKALEILKGDKQKFGKLLQDTSGARQSSDELHLQLTYYRAFSPLQPHLLHRNSERFFLRQLYSNLVRCDCQGNIKPDLAHHWKADEQALSWRFYLRPGLAFHNGVKIDAHCLVDLFTKLKEQPALKAMFSHLHTIKALHDLCLEFQLSSPDRGFAGLLSDPVCSIQPPGQFGHDNKAPHPSGSGPFRLVRHTDEVLELEPFVEYYGCRALPDRVTIWNVPRDPILGLTKSRDTSPCHYELGELIEENSSLSIEQNGERTEARLELGSQYLLFNRSKAPGLLNLHQRRWLGSLPAPERL